MSRTLIEATRGRPSQPFLNTNGSLADAGLGASARRHAPCSLLSSAGKTRPRCPDRGHRCTRERQGVHETFLQSRAVRILEQAARPPAGSRVCALFGRELKGAAFLDLWAAPSRDAIRDLLAIAANETVGAVASASG